MDFKVYEKIYNQGDNISLKNDSEEIQDMELIKTLIRMSKELYIKMPKSMKLNFEIAIEFLKTYKYDCYLPQELRENEEFLLCALKEGFIVEEEKNVLFYTKHVDEVAKAIVSEKLGTYLVPGYLEKNEEVALAYIKTGKDYLLDYDYKFKDYNIVIEGLRTNKTSFEKYVDPSLLEDEKFVKKALEEGIYSTYFNSEILKEKKYAVLAAKNGAPLSYLEHFKNDDDIIRLVVERQPYLYFQIPDNHPLKHNRDFIVNALKNGNGIHVLPNDERQKKEYLDIAAFSNVRNLFYVNDEYLKDVDNIRKILDKHTGTHLSEDCVRPYEFFSRFASKNHYKDIIGIAEKLTKDLIVRAEELNNEKYRKYITIQRKEAKECMKKLREAIIVNAFPENIEELYKKGINNISNDDLYKIASQKSRLGIFDGEIPEYLKHYNDLYDSYSNLVIALDRKKITKENSSYIKKMVDNCPDNIQNVKVCVDAPTKFLNNEGVNYTYTPQETKILNDLDRYLKIKNQDGVLLKEFGRVEKDRDLDGSWSLQQSSSATEVIDEVVKKIKEMELSPFETMLCIHKFATQFIYKKSKEGSEEKGRVLPSILNQPYIVCSGYSTFVKAIVDKLDMPSLKCDFLSCALVKDLDNFKFYDDEGKRDFDKFSYHSHILTKIKDDKYNIDGFYIEDACWDSSDKEDEPSYGVGHCLYPLEDLGRMKKFTKYIQVDFDDRYNSLLVWEKNTSSIMRGIFNKKDEIENNIYQQVNNVTVSDVVKKYGSKSVPIGLDTYQKGLEVVMSKAYPKRGENEIKSMVDDELEISRDRIKKTFKDTATSYFSEQKEEVKEEAKKEDKKQTFFSKIFKR